jgi:hypothetical protein
MFYFSQHIWNDAVARNSAALAAIVAQLWALLEVFGGADAVRIPRAVHSTILRVLRPAESALRRLIVIAARDVTVASVPPRAGLATFGKRDAPRKPPSRMSFKLIDPRKRFQIQRVTYTTLNPRISFIAPDAPFAPVFAQPASPQRMPIPSAAERPISARRLTLRLKALTSALEDIPRQAKRLVRLQLRRTSAPPRFSSPLRRGNPPGHRTRSQHEIDDILNECHKYALGVLSESKLDTS